MPSQSAKAVNYTLDPVLPVWEGQTKAVAVPVNLQPSLTSVPSGQVLANITTAAADVQTVTESGSPSSGTFTLKGTNPLTGLNFTTAAIAQAATASALQTELVKAANFGAGGCTVSGSAGGAWTVTFAGPLLNMPVPVITLGTNSLGGGSSPSVGIVHTTIGRSAGSYGLYDSSVAAPPTVPVPTGTGSGSAFGAGTHLVVLTGVNAQGETSASPPAPVTLTSAQKIRVAAITGLSTTFTALNVYVDGFFVGTAACSAGTSTQTDFDVATLTAAGKHAPLVNTAYTIPNGAGCQTAACINKYTCQTDALGQIAFSSTQGVDEWGQTSESTSTFIAGYFKTSQLTGFDAKALTDLGGHLIQGTVTSGIVRIP